MNMVNWRGQRSGYQKTRFQVQLLPLSNWGINSCLVCLNLGCSICKIGIVIPTLNMLCLLVFQQNRGYKSVFVNCRVLDMWSTKSFSFLGSRFSHLMFLGSSNQQFPRKQMCLMELNVTQDLDVCSQCPRNWSFLRVNGTLWVILPQSVESPNVLCLSSIIYNM